MGRFTVAFTVLLAAGAAWAQPTLQKQALSRLGHLDRAYTTTTRDSWSRSSLDGTTRTYRHSNTIRIDTSRPLISIGRLKLLHWGITKEQAVQRLAKGKPVRFAIRSQHITLGGEPHFHSTLIGPKLTTRSLSKMLSWSRDAEQFMARRVAHGQLKLQLE